MGQARPQHSRGAVGWIRHGCRLDMARDTRRQRGRGLRGVDDWSWRRNWGRQRRGRLVTRRRHAAGRWPSQRDRVAPSWRISQHTHERVFIRGHAGEAARVDAGQCARIEHTCRHAGIARFTPRWDLRRRRRFGAPGTPQPPEHRPRLFRLPVSSHVSHAADLSPPRGRQEPSMRDARSHKTNTPQRLHYRQAPPATQGVLSRRRPLLYRIIDCGNATAGDAGNEAAWAGVGGRMWAQVSRVESGARARGRSAGGNVPHSGDR